MNTKEKIEIMQAWLDGKPIQCCSDGSRWETLTEEPLWDFMSNEYRIKPKQKVKKVIKYLCFEDDNGNLYYYREYSENCEYYLKNSIHTRIPEFDKTREIEIEE